MTAALSFDALVCAAERQVPRHALDYCLGAAGDERACDGNVAAFDALTLVPRVARAVREVELRTRVTGGVLDAPLLVAPMSLQALLHPRAEAATAAAAAAVGVGFCLSTFSSLGPGDVVAGAGRGMRWFQLYILNDRGLTRHLAEQARENGFAAIVCTLDVPVAGHRPRDLANNLDRFATAPPALASDPLLLELSRELDLSAKDTIDRVFPNPDCDWDDVSELISVAGLPVLVKGILHPDDACLARDLGAAGVVVSNHGGRQLDRVIPSAEALPGIRAAVGDGFPVYVDSGVRRPSHVAAALALGADAVLIGRPVLMALAAGGQALVESYLRDFIARLADVLRMAGVTSVKDCAAIEVRRQLRGGL
jgi:isopentenyl diphosphate isomerase/L-lactate dehydrogenase-like FMN-dependent dehydrogenase